LRQRDFTISLGEDRLLATFQSMPRRHVPEGIVKPALIVMVNELPDRVTSLLGGQGNIRPKTFLLERAVPCQRSILPLLGDSTNVRQTGGADELFEVPGMNLLELREPTLLGAGLPLRLALFARTPTRRSQTIASATDKTAWPRSDVRRRYPTPEPCRPSGV